MPARPPEESRPAAAAAAVEDGSAGGGGGGIGTDREEFADARSGLSPPRSSARGTRPVHVARTTTPEQEFHEARERLTPAYEYQRSRSDDDDESDGDDFEADGCLGCVPRPPGSRRHGDDLENDFDAALAVVDPDEEKGRRRKNDDGGEGVDRFLECLFGLPFLPPPPPTRGRSDDGDDASRAVVASRALVSSNGDPSSSTAARRSSPRAVVVTEEAEAVGNDYFLAPIREMSGPDCEAAPRSWSSPPPPLLSERTASFRSAVSERTAEDGAGSAAARAAVVVVGDGLDAAADDEDVVVVGKKKKKKGKLRAIKKTMLRAGSRGKRRKGRKDDDGGDGSEASSSAHRRVDSACDSIDSDAAAAATANKGDDVSSVTGSLSPSPRRKPPGVVGDTSDVGGETDDAMANVRAEIDRQLALLEGAETKLGTRRADLAKTDEDARSIVRTATEISSRVDQLRTAVENLEIVLDRSRRALEQERKLLAEERAKMDRLEAARVDVESDVADVEREVAERTSYLDSLRDRTKAAGGNDGASPPEASGGAAVGGPAEEPTVEGSPAGLDGSSLHEHPIVPVEEEETEAGAAGGGNVENGSQGGTDRRDEEEKDTPRVDNKAKQLPPAAKKLRRSSSSFIRVHDLQLPNVSGHSRASDASNGSSASPQAKGEGTSDGDDDFSPLDDELRSILSALNDVGYRAITDEGERWVPSRDTERILAKREKTAASAAAGGKKGTTVDDGPRDTRIWHYARGKDVLVWSGTVDHGTYGSDLPVVKARGIVRTSARSLLDLLLDSSRVKEYNKLSHGREDDFVYQSGVDTSKIESPYGLDGEIKILRSKNKPPVVRRHIEMLTIIHARALDESKGEGRGYMAVSRSVWESPEQAKKGTSNVDENVRRSELVLGVNYIRESPGAKKETECELTTLTHVYSPMVPRGFAKKFAPTAASSFVKDLQSLWE